MSRRGVTVSAAALALAVFVADQAVKRMVEGSMGLGESIPVVSGVLHITYIENSGGAFGLLEDSPLLLLVGSVVAVGVVLFMLLTQPPSAAMAAGCGLVLGGAAGNMLDRVVSGSVVDYVDLRVWPIFNIADIGIVLGVAALLLAALRTPEKG